VGLSTPNGYGVCGCSADGLCEGGPPPKLVINEVDHDLQTGSIFWMNEFLEFVELRNTGDVTFDAAFVNALFLVSLRMNNGVVEFDTVHPMPDPLGPGWSPQEYMVIGGFGLGPTQCATSADCPNGQPTCNGGYCTPTVVPLSVPLSSGGVGVWANSNRCFALVLGDPNSADAVLVDAVCYETVIGVGDPAWWAPEGSKIAGVDAGDSSSLARCPNGADTDDNAADFTVTDDPTPGTANDCGGVTQPDDPGQGA
jgi:hypothetical protein